MTVNYAQEVATERVGGFFRMLFRWRGSIYRAVFGEMTIFLVLYYSLMLFYYVALKLPQQRYLTRFCKSCDDFSDYIPVTFIVGFYVIRVIARRWTQWENIPWPDSYVFNISGNLHGIDVSARMLRRTLARYVNLGSILCFRDISIPVRKRFPNLEYLINAGLMTPEEQKLYEETSCDIDTNWWIPFHWAFVLVEKAYKEERLNFGQMDKIRDHILDLRQKCWVLFSHDWIPVPMVYTQVVTLAVYLYMLACLFGRQSFASFEFTPKYNATSADSDAYVISRDKKHAEFWFPFFTVCQIVFYLGWLKVGEILINPFGSDADDFEINGIIDRNLRVSYTVVDYSYNRLPPVEKDIHWDKEEPDIPHTVASAKAGGTTAFIGSAANVNVSNQQAGITDAGTGTEAADGRVPSRQTSASGHKASSSIFKSITRLMSKDNETLDGVKSPQPAASPVVKHKKRKKDGPSAASSEIALRNLDHDQGSLESGQQLSRPQSFHQQQSRLAKIDESGEVLIQLLNESGVPRRGDGGSAFYLSGTPPVSSTPSQESDTGRPSLQRQDRNLPAADSPPVDTTKEPPDVL